MVIIRGRRRGARARARAYGPTGRVLRRHEDGSSCTRHVCLVQSGCCIVEVGGCGPQLALLGPHRLRRSARAASRQHHDVPARRLSRWVRAFLMAAIHLYQEEISPPRRPCCRYRPTCSNYALQALETHGVVHGVRLAVGRLLRCRPGAQGGADPVPASAPR